MPLPLVVAAPYIAAAVAAAAAGTAGYVAGKKKNNSSDKERSTRSDSSPKKSIPDDRFADVSFGLKVLVSACYVDGGRTEEENKEIQKIINDKLYKDYSITKSQREKIESIKEAGYFGFGELEKAYEATHNMNSIEEMMYALERLVKADDKVENE